MKFFYVLAALFAAIFAATEAAPEPIFDGGVVSIPLGALLVGAAIKGGIGLKLLAASRGRGGRGRKGGYRHRRAAEELPQALYYL
jgi:uncharacterized integral membrane protein